MTNKEAKQFMVEIGKAGEPGRLGITRADTMEWLLRFVQTDLSRLSKGDWENLAFEIACFMQYAGPHAETDEAREFYCLKKWDGKPYSSKNLEGSPAIATLRHHVNILRDAFSLQPSLPNQKDLLALHSQVKNMLFEIMDRGVFVFQRPHTTQYLERWPGKYGPPEKAIPSLIRSITLAETPPDLFIIHAYDYLEQFAEKLAKCPECSTVFLLERTNKKYCSLQCQTRVATRRNRNTPPDRVGKRGRPKGSGKQAMKAKHTKALSGKRRPS